MTTAMAAAVVIAAAAALVSAGVCFVLLRRLRELVEQQQTLKQQLGAVDEAVCAIEARLDGTAVIEAPAEVAGAAVQVDSEGEALRGEGIDEEIAPEIQAAIAAAAVAAAGEKARVRSMRLVKPEERSAWSQQGRVLVQTSHNVRAPR